jgi:hypothetical protein
VGQSDLITKLPQLGISIKVDAAGIDIPASCISVRYRSIPVPEYSDTGVFRYRTGSGTHIFVLYGTGLAGCRTVRYLKKGHTLHVHTAVGGKEYTLHVRLQLVLVLFLLYDIEKSYVNAAMPECRTLSPLSKLFISL